MALQIQEAGPAQRPGNWTTFRSFEDRLPLSSILCDGVPPPPPLCDEQETGAQIHDVTAGRPPLICLFCRDIKGFHRPTKLWAHLVHEHGRSEDEGRLLGEVRRTASLWSDYWERHSSEMSRKDGNTQAKLLQAAQEGFRWRDVVAWGLR